MEGSDAKNVLSSRFAPSLENAAKSSASFRQRDRTASAQERDRRQAQYEATEAAIQKYREQAKNYRENITRIKQNVQSSIDRDNVRERHRSASPYAPVNTSYEGQTANLTHEKYTHTHNSSLGQEKYSPDIMVTRQPHRDYNNNSDLIADEFGKPLNRS